MRRLLLFLVAVLSVGTACTSSPTPSAPAPRDATAIVLADATEPSTLNPLLGYAPFGAAKIFNGLLEFQADGSLQPVLAAAMPQAAADGRSWTIRIRSGVKFSDGTELTAQDVVATYRALLDPARQSPLRADYDMLTAVDQTDDANTVRFTLAYPYPAFTVKLVLGILPHTAVAGSGPLTSSAVNDKPIGTGPYQLVEWRKGDRMILRANQFYFAGVPKVTTLTVVFVPDDTARAQRMRNNEFDGAELSPQQAADVGKLSGFRVVTENSADLWAVSMPIGAPVSGDHAIRLAMNYAIDRDAVIGSALSGKGSPAFTPMPPALPEFVESQAKYRYDKATAERILDQAGWVAAASGVRVRNGVPARFDVSYVAGDQERAAVITAFAAQAKTVGIEVTPVPVPANQLTDHPRNDAELISTGNPFDPDLAMYPLLHSGGTANTTGYADAQVDADLDAAKHAGDPSARAVAYRAAQRSYLADPALVCLAFVNHTYVVHDDWNGYQPVVEPAEHGALTWGPWWSLATWTPR